MRKINLKGANNSRDFGGITNKEGKEIRPFCFLRSNALHKLSEKDKKTLSETYRLGTVIDLRTAIEKEGAPDILPEGTKFFHLPVFAEEVMGITHENNSDPKKMLDNLPDMCNLYKVMVTNEDCISQLRKIFEIISSSDGERAVLWHCTQGKDRCGLVSAFLLFILEVDRETVFEDYLKTNETAKRKASLLRFLVKYYLRRPEDAECVYLVMQAQREYLDAALTAIDETWGGMDCFIKNQLGISDEVREKMKERFLV